jgi:hypothetical protein
MPCSTRARVVDEHHAAHTQTIAALESTVNENKIATAETIRETYAVLWRDYTEKVFQLKLDHDNQLAELRADHEKTSRPRQNVWHCLSDQRGESSSIT